MKAPTTKESYPQYFRLEKKLLAFLGPTDMYKIEAIGSNKNEGITIDRYITRKMVIQHYPGWGCPDISQETFKTLATKLFGAYIDKMIP